MGTNLACPSIMLARQAVLLTPSKSVHPLRLLSYKHFAPVSPLFATPTKSSHLHHSTSFSFLVFSYTYELFCTVQKLNPFFFMRFRTLCQKHGGWGWGATPLTRIALYRSRSLSSQNGSTIAIPSFFATPFNFRLSTASLPRHPPPASHPSLAGRIGAAAIQGVPHA